MISISPSWQPYLWSLPEYGMGYQKAKIKFSNGAYETGFIFNASTFIKAEESNYLTPLQLYLEELKLSRQVAYNSISDITLIPRPPETLRGVKRVFNKSASLESFSGSEYARTIRASQAAEDAPTTATVAGEIFKRFSAYVNDFRITAKKGLQPGTFATTAEDAENVKSGSDAVNRYALENKQSANKRFTINPAKDTSHKRGVTQPAYGEPGGGIEVIFVDGTGDNTVSGPDILPE